MNGQERKIELKKPVCPFCGLPLDRPRETAARRPGDMPVGSCACGAVYAYDATGHNLGAAFIEALVFACNMDWDLAWGLLPEDDYLEALVEKYDYESNLIIPGGFYEGRKIPGALYFIRLHDDIREVTARGVRERLARSRPASAAPGRRSAATEKAAALTKKEVEELVRAYRVEPLLAGAGDKKLLRHLQRLLYSGDELLRRRAAEMLGRAAAAIAGRDPGSVSVLLQGLSTSVTDSAASGWGAVDAIGEIISRTGTLFAGYVPVLYQYMEDGQLRARALAALAEIAAAGPALIQKPVYGFLSCLADDRAAVRGYAALLLGRLRAREAVEGLRRLCDDDGEVVVYHHGRLEKKTVGRLAREALEKI